jgi:hypothetical protein
MGDFTVNVRQKPMDFNRWQLGLHKKRVTAWRLLSDSTGQAPEGIAALQTFGTMTHELLALADWLVEAGSRMERWKAPESIGSPSPIGGKVW